MPRVPSFENREAKRAQLKQTIINKLEPVLDADLLTGFKNINDNEIRDWIFQVQIIRELKAIKDKLP